MGDTFKELTKKIDRSYLGRTLFAHPTHQVTGNFSPGQFGFKNEQEANDWANAKKKEGYKVEVSKC